ncbi:hypothetical protein PLEOSDRAFT_1101349 [Pleurotus ostreatus PC15]|uniref:Uncharacterized protein n=1 Tax=Pleurotus ostreatus (strain PC15) TaxID=1137138 RepID=A0A067NTP3_PLEO1|nr:hypothetical protein PLEOSDRAFT_1101349 [Pleurotus ostreatus PC15]
MPNGPDQFPVPPTNAPEPKCSADTHAPPPTHPLTHGVLLKATRRRYFGIWDLGFWDLEYGGGGGVNVRKAKLRKCIS